MSSLHLSFLEETPRLAQLQTNNSKAIWICLKSVGLVFVVKAYLFLFFFFPFGFGKQYFYATLEVSK